MQSTPQSHQEIEVKIRLLSGEDYKRVADLLSSGFKQIDSQVNFFLDGVKGELRACKAVLRLRQTNGTHYVWTLKQSTVLDNGVARSKEKTEEAVNLESAKMVLDDPNTINNLLSTSPLLHSVANQFKCTDWKFIGHFSNTRKKYEWRGFIVELDETVYPFGTAYEIEIETDRPSEAKHEIEAVLKENGIEFAHSGRSKFANMINGSIL